MNIQERGDALLTAYVNKDFETVKTLWVETARNAEPDGDGPVIALHAHKNPSITDVGVGVAVAKSVNMSRDYEAEAREENEINAAKRKLYSLGYDEFFDEVHGFVRWEHTRTGHRAMDSDPRKVLESLKK